MQASAHGPIRASERGRRCESEVSTSEEMVMRA
jgi:hypothetical protein